MPCLAVDKTNWPNLDSKQRIAVCVERHSTYGKNADIVEVDIRGVRSSAGRPSQRIPPFNATFWPV